MLQFRKGIVAGGLGLFLLAGVAATKPPAGDEPKFKNVKVIANDIGADNMERIMTTIEHQLGVTCIYCHAATKPGIFPKDVDFASDEKPEKKIARQMLKMTIALNKKYFGFKVDRILFNKPVIWCVTCHRGYIRPILRPAPIYRP
jgi:Photosynthetic reaction centre cytochrome C subunit